MTLFGPEPEAPATVDTDAAAVWSAMPTNTRHRCDVCVERTMRQPWAVINRARWKRRQGRRERLFCAEHAHDARTEDNDERRP